MESVVLVGLLAELMNSSLTLPVFSLQFRYKLGMELLLLYLLLFAILIPHVRQADGDALLNEYIIMKNYVSSSSHATDTLQGHRVVVVLFVTFG